MRTQHVWKELKAPDPKVDKSITGKNGAAADIEQSKVCS